MQQTIFMSPNENIQPVIYWTLWACTENVESVQNTKIFSAGKGIIYTIDLKEYCWQPLVIFVAVHSIYHCMHFPVLNIRRRQSMKCSIAEKCNVNSGASILALLANQTAAVFLVCLFFRPAYSQKSFTPPKFQQINVEGRA